MERKKAPATPKPSKSGPQELSTARAGGAYSFLARTELPKAEDPRFREECGEVDHIGIVKNYAFLQQYRQNEIARLNQQLRDSDPADQEQLIKKRQSLQDQCQTFDGKMRTVQESIDWHREERQRVLDGKKPFWLDKKGLKEAKQKRKFQELSESGKLHKYLNRRGKKMAAKDKKQGRTAGFM